VKAQWLTVQSFQHSQELLAAINTLSIHLKLETEGASDQERAQAADASRHKLDGFLKELEQLVGESDRDEIKPVLGTDPRTRQLAEGFLEARRDRTRFRSVLFQDDISRARRLLHSVKDEDREPLLRCLDDLRVLLQEHVQADASQIMGQI
jgi:hypothetical protein